MAYIPIPASPVLNVDHVTAIKRTDLVVAEFVNDYYQRFLENDAALDSRVVEVEEAIDHMPTETDYDTAASYTEPGHIVDCLVIREMKQSFQAGCSQIAGAITGGRDSEGTGGVPTAGDAPLATMTGNITQLAYLNYQAGFSAGSALSEGMAYAEKTFSFTCSKTGRTTGTVSLSSYGTVYKAYLISGTVHYHTWENGDANVDMSVELSQDGRSAIVTYAGSAFEGNSGVTGCSGKLGIVYAVDITQSTAYRAGQDSVVIVNLDFGNDWWNPSDTSGTTWDYKTKNISSLYANYAHITQSNITAFIKQFSGTGGDDLRVNVNSYTPSTGVISIGCNGNLNQLQVSLVIRPS